MTTTSLRALKAKLRPRNRRQQGFTLVELLIVTLIAGGIVSGLMFLVVELLTADQRDASRNATQQDMQRSLDYISAELRDAVYVYSGACLYGSTGCTRSDNKGILDYLPASLRSATSTPVIAFWKQAPLPSNVLAYCSARSSQDSITDGSGNRIPCIAGHAYSLVVYSLDRAAPSDSPWSGKARITRYELRQYGNQSSTPARVTGYVSPISGPRNLFASWPLNLENVSQQSNRPTATGAIVPLTDFVDFVSGERPVACPVDTSVSPPNPNGYQMSPPQANAPASFYACINTSSSTATPALTASSNQTKSIENQEVVLYLRGNGSGRPSITDTGNSVYKPTLTTRVFNRGTLDINPTQQN